MPNRINQQLLNLLIATCAWVLFPIASAIAQPQQPISYEIRTPKLLNHELHITASFPLESFSQNPPVLALANWTPGSYKIRDYSKSLVDVRLLDAKNAKIEKIAKNRWHILGDLTPDQPVRVAYTVYGHELSVRTNYFTPDFTLIVGAATFLAPAPLKSEALEQLDFQISFPDLLSLISTPLQDAPSSAGTPPTHSHPSFVAHGYDELVDSPIVFGDLSIGTMTIPGPSHQLIHAGDRHFWNERQALIDTQKVVTEVQKFWGQVPYSSYKFYNLIAETRGGLEHKASSVLGSSRFSTSDPKSYQSWLSVVCHELFHAWNGKRLRPYGLGPFDYEQELTTRSLWAAEGLTSYYDDLLIHRAGLTTRADYFEALSTQINALLQTPGRLKIPVTEASFDAWIRSYQPTENSINDDVSYYTKGAVIGWLLDTEIRRRTNGKKSLDQVLRATYQTLANTGYTEESLRSTLSQNAGIDLSTFFHHALDTTNELDIDSALAYWGLGWQVESKQPAPPYFGVRPSSGDPRQIASVAAGSPAALAGLSPGDEIIAIDGIRLPAQGPEAIIKHLKIKQSYPVLFSRLGRIQELKVTLTPTLPPNRKLVILQGPLAHPHRIDAWLGPGTPYKTPSRSS